MVNFNESKVYIIEPTVERLDDGDIYIGSTTKKRLSQRMDTHRSQYKRWKDGKKLSNVTSYGLFDRYGLKNCKITLLETCPCNSRDELRARESYHIKNRKCVNKRIPNRTKEEWKAENEEKIKQYYQDNKEEISKKQKQHYQDNKEEILKKQKQYNKDNQEKNSKKQKQHYQDNKEEISKKQKDYQEKNSEKIKQYYQDNKEEISKKQKQYYLDNMDKLKRPFICQCGKECKNNNKTRHFKSISHLQYMNTNTLVNTPQVISNEMA
jgi:hypothetical protein